jgi:hypothetical protein
MEPNRRASNFNTIGCDQKHSPHHLETWTSCAVVSDCSNKSVVLSSSDCALVYTGGATTFQRGLVGAVAGIGKL